MSTERGGLMTKSKFVKTIAIIISLSLIMVLLPSNGQAENKAGDIDGDGDVDYDDAYLIFNYVAGTGTLELSQLDCADIDGDGRITIGDAAQVFHYVSGYFSVLPYMPKGNGRLVILSYPDKTEYIEGENLDMTGFELAVEYENGQTETVTGYTYSGFSAGTGVKIIVVSYQTAKTAFIVTVYPVNITAIEITTPPVKLVYNRGESLDLTGLKVSAILADGRKVIVNNYIVSGYESTPGTCTITVSYRLKKTFFTVTVK
ncbi:MAG: hypothetical protein GX148_02945 [Clostridiales bacterium]|nr:hypothetical protein [Clostridiales bacterium]